MYKVLLNSPLYTRYVFILQARYILYQRTELQDFSNWFLYKLLSGRRFSISYKTWIFIQAIFFSKHIITEYKKLLIIDYKEFKDFLPEKADNLLDIGCGLGGINLKISKNYKDKIKIILYDKSVIDKKIYYNFKSKGAFYNSLKLAKAFLNLNGISKSNMISIEYNKNNIIPIDHKVDIVISLLSWGFHYPIGTYIDQIKNILSNKGVLILDIRRGEGGMEELKGCFNIDPIVIRKTDKYNRIIIKH